MDEKYSYDERKKVLIVTRSHELQNPANKENVGTRTNKDSFPETGIRAMRKELYSQLHELEKNSKGVVGLIEEQKDVEVDEEFLSKYEAVNAMKKKQQLVENLTNMNVSIKTLKEQIKNMEGAVGSRIKW